MCLELAQQEILAAQERDAEPVTRVADDRQAAGIAATLRKSQSLLAAVFIRSIALLPRPRRGSVV